MGDLVVVADQLTFPWRDRARTCPKCKGKGGEPWLSTRRDAKGQAVAEKLIPCIRCKGTGELPIERAP